MIPCIIKYRITKEKNLYGSQNGLRKEKTEGRDKGTSYAQNILL